MKNLILIRHAKSSWKYNVQDHQRPLKQRGIKDAHLVANKFLSLKPKIESIHTSFAIRTIETCEIFTKIINDQEIHFEVSEDLYDFAGQKVIEYLKNLDDNHTFTVVFGHNNALTSISNIFGDQFIPHLPTCGLVWLTFDIDSWSQLKKGKTKLTIFPRELK